MLSIQAWLKHHSPLSIHVEDPISVNQLRLLLEHSLQKNRAWIFTHPDHQLTERQIKQLNNWVEALKAGQPLAYVTGEQMFWDLNLKVNSHTLIPRPDTEILIETVTEILSDKPPKRILDLGTGSGALALVLAKIFPDAVVLGVDQSPEALLVATENATRHQIKNIEFQQSNWFNHLTSSQFDLIVSNPPYINADDSHLSALQHEPMTALVADQNGLGDFIRITNKAKEFLTVNGLLMFEHGWQQQHQVQAILHAAGFKHIDSRKDLAGNDRVTFAFNC